MTQEGGRESRRITNPHKTMSSLPAFTPTTSAEEVAAAFADQIRGRNVLITGTSIDGIGFEAARVLAKLKLSEEAIKKETPDANIRPLVLDLSSLAAVRKAAAKVNTYPEPLHVLINNAAGGGPEWPRDYIGPFLFTKLLVPKLLATASESYVPRVVVVASDAHAFVPLDVNMVAHPSSDTYDLFGTYCQAKGANILFANELSRRAKGKLNVYSLHPGDAEQFNLEVIHTNSLKKEDNKAALIAIGTLTPEGLPNPDLSWKTLGQGAATTVAGTFDMRLDSKSGAYLVDCVEANDKVAPHCSDPETAAKLWTVTEKIIGEKFTF
ncbi:Short-chain dehydrogenase/reductase family protein [Mycena sanguinolenta]|uniref:Short-chain dehydrogenase/reductase family protein n=1 Tax=Mycena sanguinolenta TaxID=230812 RepID=A0A8H7CS07_9AGAR|nr:Short-chain dehydrogenase/reductase family protein [Mycena sanguinolenta]